MEVSATASRPDRFTPEKRNPGTHSIGGWVGPRGGRDVSDSRKVFAVVGNRTPAHPARGLVATPTTISPFVTQKGVPQLLLFFVHLTTTLIVQIKEL